MSKNVNQLPDAVSLLTTDKLYLGRSPFSTADDYAITGQEVIDAAPVQSVNGQTGTVTGLIDIAGTGLTKSSTTLSITNTGVTSGTYGSASNVGQVGVNSQGQITAASNIPISITASQVSNFNSAVDTEISNQISANVIQAYNKNLQGLSNSSVLTGPVAIISDPSSIPVFYTPVGSDVSSTTYNNLNNNVNIGDTINFNSSSAKTFTLDATGLGVGYYFYISNSGSGALTFSPAGGNTIYGYTSIPGGGGSTSTTPRAKVELINISANPVWYVTSFNDFNIVAGTNITLSRSASGLTINNNSLFTTNSQSTNYTVQSTDLGAEILAGSSSGLTVTFPDTLPNGFWCNVTQNGTGTVTIASSGSLILVSFGGGFNILGQYGSCTVKIFNSSAGIVQGNV